MISFHSRIVVVWLVRSIMPLKVNGDIHALSSPSFMDPMVLVVALRFRLLCSFVCVWLR